MAEAEQSSRELVAERGMAQRFQAYRVIKPGFEGEDDMLAWQSEGRGEIYP
jgi:hypothetical protein